MCLACPVALSFSHFLLYTWLSCLMPYLLPIPLPSSSRTTPSATEEQINHVIIRVGWSQTAKQDLSSTWLWSWGKWIYWFGMNERERVVLCEWEAARLEWLSASVDVGSGVQKSFILTFWYSCYLSGPPLPSKGHKINLRGCDRIIYKVGK